MNKYWCKMALLVTLLLLIPVTSLQAAAVDYIPAGQAVEGPLFMAGDRIRIDGTVDGDIYAAGNDISITGEITGDIIAAGQNITISGPVTGDLRLAGQNVRLHGITTGSATIFGQYFDFGSKAGAGRDMLVFGETARMEGTLQRNFHGSMENLYISGTIGKDVKLFDVKNLEFNNAQIGGNLSYKSLDQADIDTDTIIGGEEQWTKATNPAAETATSPWSYAGGLFINLAALVLVWGMLRIWRPNFWQQITRPVLSNPGSSAGIGLLLLLATPLLVLLLFITVIGIPAGILILFVYGLTLYSSILITAQYLTELLKPRLNYRGNDIWLTLALLISLMLVVRIPLAGWILGIVILSIGLGSIFKTLFPDRDNPYAPDPV